MHHRCCTIKAGAGPPGCGSAGFAAAEGQLHLAVVGKPGFRFGLLGDHTAVLDVCRARVRDPTHLAVGRSERGSSGAEGLFLDIWDYAPDGRWCWRRQGRRPQPACLPARYVDRAGGESDRYQSLGPVPTGKIRCRRRAESESPQAREKPPREVRPIKVPDYSARARQGRWVVVIWIVPWRIRFRPEPRRRKCRSAGGPLLPSTVSAN